MSNGKCVLVLVLALVAGPASAQPKPELLLPLGHASHISSVAFSPDGKSVLTGSWDGAARLWDIATGKSIRTFLGHKQVHSVAFSPDGKNVLIGSFDKTARLWDIGTGRSIRTFTGHTSIVDSVAFSPDGKSVLTGSFDNSARLWDVSTGATIQTFTGHSKTITSVAVSPDGKRAFTGSSDLTARLWDIATGKTIQTFTGHKGTVRFLLFDDTDSKSVLTGSLDGTVRLWEVSTGKTLQSMPGLLTKDDIPMVLSPDYKRVLTGSWDGTTRLVEVKTGRTVQTFTGQFLIDRSAAFSPDGRSVLAGSLGKPTQLWDIATGKVIQTFVGHERDVRSVAVSPDGKRALTGSDDKTARLWDIDTGKTTQTFTGHSSHIDAVVFSPDGRSVLTGSDDKTARLWLVSTGKPTQTFTGHDGGVRSVAFSPDSRSVVTGSDDKTARLWDVSTGKSVQTFTGHSSHIGAVVFSPDGKSILTGSADNTARLWDVSTGKSVQNFVGHSSSINSVAFSPDGKRALTGSLDHTVRVWDVSTGKAIVTLAGHTHAIDSAAFSSDGKAILTWSSDGTGRLWNSMTGEQLQAILVGGDGQLAWTPQGYYSGSVEAEKLIAWKVTDPKDPRGFRIVGPELFRNTFHRPDLFKHLLAEGSVEKALAKADAERGVKTVPTEVAKEVPPVVIVTAPKHLGSVKLDEITVEAIARNATDHPVESLQLEVNGQPTGRIQRVTDPKPGQVPAEWKVKLQPGENAIQVFARAGGSVGRSDVVKVTRVAAEEKKVRLHMLVIGVGKYKLSADEGGYRKLPQAANDGKRFAEAFAVGGKGLYSEVLKPKMLFDEDATREKILDALQEFSEAMTADDVGVIFYAGHGDRANERLYLTAFDTDKTKLVRTGVSASQLRDTLAGTKGRKYLFVDACHAGGVIDRSDRSLHDDIIRELQKEATGMIIATACQGSEIANEDANGGFFTTALIEGITGKAAAGNGAVYGKELAVYVRNRLKAMTKDLPNEKQQRPIFAGSDVLMDLPLAKPGVKK